MGSAGERRHAVVNGSAGHLQGDGDSLRAIVNAWKDMAMEVDHGAASL